MWDIAIESVARTPFCDGGESQTKGWRQEIKIFMGNKVFAGTRLDGANTCYYHTVSMHSGRAVEAWGYVGQFDKTTLDTRHFSMIYTFYRWFICNSKVIANRLTCFETKANLQRLRFTWTLLENTFYEHHKNLIEWPFPVGYALPVAATGVI